MLDGVIVPIFQAIYTILHFTAGIFWTLNQALLIVGYFLMTLTHWLVADAFKPLIEQVVNQTDGLLLPIFTIAMLVLAITYLVSVFAQIKIVEMRSALMWLLFAVFVFQFAPELYEGIEQLRRGTGGEFYRAGFNALEGETNRIDGLANIGVSAQVAMDTPINEFGPFVTFDTSIDGLDVAMAYLYASGCDVLKTSGCIELGWLPAEWYLASSGHAYFDNLKSGQFFPTMTNDERQSSISRAADGIWRALSGVIVSFFGLLEQVIHLILAMAMGFSFVSLGIAVLFAFFKRTETITWAVFNMLIELFVQSIITSLLLSVVITFIIIGAGTGNAILLLGASFVMIIFMVLLIRGALTALSRSINGLIGALSTAAGGTLGTLTGAGGDVIGGIGAGVGAAAALQRGASIGQAAGLLLSGNQTMTRAAQYGQYAFGQDTALGQLSADIFAGASAANLVGRTAAGFLMEPRDRETDDSLGKNYDRSATGQSRAHWSERGPQRNNERQIRRPDSGFAFPALGTPIYSSDSEAETYEESRADDAPQRLARGSRSLAGAHLTTQGISAESHVTPSGTTFTQASSGLSPSSGQSALIPVTQQTETLFHAAQLSFEAQSFVANGMRTLPRSTGQTVTTLSSNGLSGTDVAKIDASDDDDFANLSADMSAVVSAYAAQSSAPTLLSALHKSPELPAAKPDDLTAIRGIGPHTQRRFQEAGLNTYDDLAAATPAALQAVEPRLKTDRAERMISDAAALVSSGIDRPVSSRVSAENASPADDLTAIRGIGSNTQFRLNRAGINTYDDLAAASPGQLQALIPRLSQDNAARFISDARALSASTETSTSGLSNQDVAKIDASDDDDFARLGHTITASHVSAAAPSASVSSAVKGSSPDIASPDTPSFAGAANNAQLMSGMTYAVSNGTSNVLPDFTAISAALAAALAGDAAGVRYSKPWETGAAIVSAASGGVVPNLPEVGAFAGMANLMRLSPATASAVVQNTATSGAMGTEVAAAVRSALSGIHTTSGNPLDNSTINSAMNSLQQAASAMVSAVHASAANPSTGGSSLNSSQNSAASIQVNVAASFGHASVTNGGSSSGGAGSLGSSGISEGG